jgi:hypothetical protein
MLYIALHICCTAISDQVERGRAGAGNPGREVAGSRGEHYPEHVTLDGVLAAVTPAEPAPRWTATQRGAG